MSNVLITGVNGFIGSHIADRMIQDGHHVTGLVRKSSDLSLVKDKKITLKYGDVTDSDSLCDAVNGIDIIIHNAGLASDWGPLELFMKINFEGTQNLAKAGSEAGVKRFVLLSSTAIHGFGSDTMLDESAPIKTHGFHYSISKWEAEQWLFNFSKNTSMEVTALRPGNVYGPRDHTFIEKYLDVMIQGQGGYVNGGKAHTCPLYVLNLTQAISLAATHSNAPGEAFIITDGLDITWRSFTNKLADMAGIKRPVLSIPFVIGNVLAATMEQIYLLFNSKKAPLLTRYRMHNGGKDYWFSIEKAKSMLGYVPETDLNTTLKATIDWYYSKHPKR